MSKSKYSKTKAAGLLCGMSHCKDYKFSQDGAGVVQAENRQRDDSERRSEGHNDKLR